MTPVNQPPVPHWPPYAAPTSYNYGNYYPANYGYYPDQYGGYPANYGYASYYNNNHVPATAGYVNGSEVPHSATTATTLPDKASESRDWQPFSVEEDNARYVAAQLHVIGQYHVRPRAPAVE